MISGRETPAPFAPFKKWPVTVLCPPNRAPHLHPPPPPFISRVSVPIPWPPLQFPLRQSLHQSPKYLLAPTKRYARSRFSFRSRERAERWGEGASPFAVAPPIGTLSMDSPPDTRGERTSSSSGGFERPGLTLGATGGARSWL